MQWWIACYCQLAVVAKLFPAHGLQVPPLLRAFHAYRAEMASFVTSLQYYIVFEVLEPNWAKLMTALPKAADLDAVISLHENTLQVG